MIRITYTLLTAILAVTVLLTVGCKEPKKVEPPTPPVVKIEDSEKKEVIDNYAAMVYANYQDALTGAQQLQSALTNLVNNPSAGTLETAKQAWRDSRLPYLQTEAYRFVNGPIDDANGPEGLMNAWPLDEAYIDYVDSSSTSGIINNPAMYPVINKDSLANMNQTIGEKNVSTGYHAIEFLLWGEDVSATSAGTRPFTDYVIGGTASNQQRRGQYLLACAQLLVENLQYLVDAWAPNSTTNYRYQFVNQNPDEALRKMLEAIGKLSFGELRGERIYVAYDTREQEDEHSCFSDNTHIDMIYDAKGIQNVYLGTYVRTAGDSISGKSVKDLVAKLDPTLANKLATEMQQSVDAMNAIPVPFDEALKNEASRALILQAVVHLETHSATLITAAQKLGLNITTTIK